MNAVFISLEECYLDSKKCNEEQYVHKNYTEHGSIEHTHKKSKLKLYLYL